MDIRILVLDDKLHTASTEISQSLSFFVLDDNGPFILSSKSSAVVKLKGVEPPTTLTFTCNPSNNPAQVKRLLEQSWFSGEFDLVLLDDNWGETQSEQFAGQRLLLEAVFTHVQGRGGEEPLVCLWTQHWEEDYRTKSLAKILRQKPFWGKNKVRGLSKTNYAGLLLLLQDVIAVSELQKKKAELETQLAAAEANIVAHLSLTRNKKFKESVVTPELFGKIAERVEPFLQLKEGSFEGIRDDLKLTFPVGVFLEGTDPLFIDWVCGAIAASLTDRPQLLSAYIDSGAGTDPKIGLSWSLLSEGMASFYSDTATDPVVVIRADNVDWPDELDAEGHDPMDSLAVVLRRHLESAMQINAGKMPSDADLVFSIKSGLSERRENHYADLIANATEEFPFSGKILWLFARRRENNSNENNSNKLLDSVAAILAPAIQLNFSDDDRVRRRVLAEYAQRRGCRFTPGAMKLSLKTTRGLSFGQLIGKPEWSTGSFLAAASQRAKLNANILFRQTESEAARDEITAIITEQIVEDVVADFALNHRDDNSNNSGESKIAHAGAAYSNNARGNAKTEQRLRYAEAKLDEYEELARKVRAERPEVKSSELRNAIAKELGVKPGNITQVRNRYSTELRRLLNDPNNVGRWPLMRQVSTFQKLINVPVG